MEKKRKRACVNMGLMAQPINKQTKSLTLSVTLLIDSHAIINLNHSTYKSSRTLLNTK
jgi:hypothetical protein